MFNIYVNIFWDVWEKYLKYIDFQKGNIKTLSNIDMPEPLKWKGYDIDIVNVFCTQLFGLLCLTKVL